MSSTETADQVAEIQMLYPRIYMACHTEHPRAATSEARLSSRDSGILAHLSTHELTTPSRLARHLNVSTPTLSQALSRLKALGYVLVRRDEEDERRQRVSLTAKGLKAMRETSVLDAREISRLLSHLSRSERKRAIEGLALLARAALGA